MTIKGTMVCELSDSVYRSSIGAIRSQLSRHARIDIERATNDHGAKVVQIWSQYPTAVRSAVRSVLGKDYAPRGKEV